MEIDHSEQKKDQLKRQMSKAEEEQEKCVETEKIRSRKSQ